MNSALTATDGLVDASALLGAQNRVSGVPEDVSCERASVSVVMPTLNEAANLRHVFARMPFDLID